MSWTVNVDSFKIIWILQITYNILYCNYHNNFKCIKSIFVNYFYKIQINSITWSSSSVWGMSSSSSLVLNSNFAMVGGKKSPRMILKPGFLRIRRPPIHRSAKITCERGWDKNLKKTNDILEVAKNKEELVKMYVFSQFIGRLLTFIFVSRHLGNANFLKPSKN